MDGLGILDQVADPFWIVTHPPEVRHNPFHYWCASNGATPDYVSSDKVSEFIAYAFMMCYDNVSPEYFTMWNMVTKNSVQWLRESFLMILERFVLEYYDGNITNTTNYHDLDHSVWSEGINIGDRDGGDKDEVSMNWCPGPIDEESFSLQLSCDVLYGDGRSSDPEVIWLRFSALHNRGAVCEAIRAARATNALNTNSHFNPEDWDKAIKEQK